MTTRVIFYNNGTLDRRAFTMLGLSAKSSDNAIGFFGTGFKYALSVLLRHGADISVITPETKYVFYTDKGSFRDKEFDFIYAHDMTTDREFELPFTTHLGANWKLWQAYRELYTNALDEGGGVMTTDAPVQEFENMGSVMVIVELNELVAIAAEHDKYFIKADAVASDKIIRCVEKRHNDDNVIYYRSMYTGTKTEKPTYFTYDYVHKVQLTEDRTLADPWYISSHIYDLWIRGMTYDALVEHLPKIAHSSYYESQLQPSYREPSADFIKACAFLVEHHLTMPLWARDTYIKTRPLDEQYDRYKPTKFERLQLDHAIKVLNHHNIMVTHNVLHLCVSLPDDVLGLTRDGKIYIAKLAFERGPVAILGTIYEEWLHYSEELEDHTRKMQNVLVDKCASLMEQVYQIEHSESNQ
jgi:hypothetical protein